MCIEASTAILRPKKLSNFCCRSAPGALSARSFVRPCAAAAGGGRAAVRGGGGRRGAGSVRRGGVTPRGLEARGGGGVAHLDPHPGKISRGRGRTEISAAPSKFRCAATSGAGGQGSVARLKPRRVGFEAARRARAFELRPLRQAS
jgi:hypothetical protein